MSVLGIPRLHRARPVRVFTHEPRQPVRLMRARSGVDASRQTRLFALLVRGVRTRDGSQRATTGRQERRHAIASGRPPAANPERTPIRLPKVPSVMRRRWDPKTRVRRRDEAG